VLRLLRPTASTADAARAALPGPPALKNRTAQFRVVATGVILLEEKGELDLDTRPCKGRVYAFHSPYKKEARGKVTCDSKEFPQYSVEQK